MTHQKRIIKTNVNPTLDDYFPNISSSEVEILKKVYSNLEQDSEVQNLNFEYFSEVYFDTKIYCKNLHKFDTKILVSWFKVQLSRYQIFSYLEEAEQKLYAEDNLFDDLLKGSKLTITSKKLLHLLKTQDKNGSYLFLKVYVKLKLSLSESADEVYFTKDELKTFGYTEEDINSLMSIKENKNESTQQTLLLNRKEAHTLSECYQYLMYKLEEQFSELCEARIDPHFIFLMVPLHSDPRYSYNPKSSTLTQFKFNSRIQFLLSRFLRYQSYIEAYQEKKTKGEISIEQFKELMTSYFPRLYEENLTTKMTFYSISNLVATVPGLIQYIGRKILYLVSKARDLQYLPIEIAIISNFLNLNIENKIIDETVLTFSEVEILQTILSVNWNDILLIQKDSLDYNYQSESAAISSALINCYNEDIEKVLQKLLNDYLLPYPLLEVLVERRKQYISNEVIYLQHFHPQEKSTEGYLKRLHLLLEKADGSLSATVPIFGTVFIQLIALGHIKAATILLGYNQTLAENKRFDVNATTAFGFTALPLASLNSYAALLVNCLWQDTDFSKKLNNGFSIMDFLAFTEGKFEVNGKPLEINRQQISLEFAYIEGEYQLEIFNSVNKLGFILHSKNLSEILEMCGIAVTVEPNIPNYKEKLRNIFSSIRSSRIYYHSLSSLDQCYLSYCVQTLKKEQPKTQALTFENIIFIYQQFKDVVQNSSMFTVEEIYQWIKSQVNCYQLVDIYYQSQDQNEKEKLRDFYNKIPTNKKPNLKEEQIKILFKRNGEKNERPFSHFWVWVKNKLNVLDQEEQQKKKVVHERTITIPISELSVFDQQQLAVIKKLNMDEKLVDAIKLRIAELIYLLDCYEIYLFNQNKIFITQAAKTIFKTEPENNNAAEIRADMRLLFFILSSAYPIMSEDIDEKIVMKSFKSFIQFLIYKIIVFRSYVKMSSAPPKFQDTTSVTEKFFPLLAKDDFLTPNDIEHYTTHLDKSISPIVLEEWGRVILDFLAAPDLGTRRIEWMYYVQYLAMGKMKNIRCVSESELDVLNVFLKTNWNNILCPLKDSITKKYFKHELDKKLTFETVIVKFFEKESYLDFIKSLLNKYLLPNDLLKVLLLNYPQCVQKRFDNEQQVLPTLLFQHYFPEDENHLAQYRVRLEIIIKDLSLPFEKIGHPLNLLIKKELFSHAEELIKFNKNLVDEKKLPILATDSHGYTALHLAIIHCAPFSLIESLIKDYPQLLQAKSVLSESVIYLATLYGRVDVLRLIMSCSTKADIYADLTLALSDAILVKETVKAKGELQDIDYEQRSVGSQFSHLRIDNSHLLSLPMESGTTFQVKASRDELYDENNRFTEVHDRILALLLVKDVMKDQEKNFLVQQMEHLDKQSLLDFYEVVHRILKNIFSYAQNQSELMDTKDNNGLVIMRFEKLINRFFAFQNALLQLIDKCIENPKVMQRSEFENYLFMLSKKCGQYTLIMRSNDKNFMLQFEDDLRKTYSDQSLIQKMTFSKTKDNSVTLVLNNADYSTLLELVSYVSLFEDRLALEKQLQAERERAEKERLFEKSFTVVQSRRAKREKREERNKTKNSEDIIANNGTGLNFLRRQ